MVVDLDMIDRIMIPLLFSSLIICQTRQQIIERYPSGDKKIVSVYKGSGLSEQLVWRYTFHVDGSLIRYENFQENLNYKISDDDLHFVDKINNQKAMGELINVLGKDWKAFRNNESYQYQLINNDLFNFLSKDKWVSNYSVETQRLQGFIRMSVPTPVTLTLEFKRRLLNGEIHKHMSTIKFFNEVLNPLFDSLIVKYSGFINVNENYFSIANSILFTRNFYTQIYTYTIFILKFLYFYT